MPPGPVPPDAFTTRRPRRPDVEPDEDAPRSPLAPWSLGPAAAAAAVLAGLLAGRSIGTEGMLLVSGSALAGMALAVAAVCETPWQDAGRIVGRLAGVWLITYTAFSAATEQFAWAQTEARVVVAVLWLTPLICGAVLLPGRGHRRAGWACLAVLFAATTALSYTVFHVNRGMGLFFQWIS